MSLNIIELKNHKDMKKKCEIFDYKYFGKNLEDSIFILKDKKVDIDELIKRLDNYVL